MHTPTQTHTPHTYTPTQKYICAYSKFKKQHMRYINCTNNPQLKINFPIIACEV